MAVSAVLVIFILIVIAVLWYMIYRALRKWFLSPNYNHYRIRCCRLRICRLFCCSTEEDADADFGSVRINVESRDASLEEINLSINESIEPSPRDNMDLSSESDDVFIYTKVKPDQETRNLLVPGPLISTVPDVVISIEDSNNTSDHSSCSDCAELRGSPRKQCHCEVWNTAVSKTDECDLSNVVGNIDDGCELSDVVVENNGDRNPSNEIVSNNDGFDWSNSIVNSNDYCNLSAVVINNNDNRDLSNVVANKTDACDLRSVVVNKNEGTRRKLIRIPMVHTDVSDIVNATRESECSILIEEDNGLGSEVPREGISVAVPLPVVSAGIKNQNDHYGNRYGARPKDINPLASRPASGKGMNIMPKISRDTLRKNRGTFQSEVTRKTSTYSERQKSDLGKSSQIYSKESKVKKKDSEEKRRSVTKGNNSSSVVVPPHDRRHQTNDYGSENRGTSQSEVARKTSKKSGKESDLEKIGHNSSQFFSKGSLVVKKDSEVKRHSGTKGSQGSSSKSKYTTPLPPRAARRTKFSPNTNRDTPNENHGTSQSRRAALDGIRYSDSKAVKKTRPKSGEKRNKNEGNKRKALFPTLKNWITTKYYKKVSTLHKGENFYTHCNGRYVSKNPRIFSRLNKPATVKNGINSVMRNNVSSTGRPPVKPFMCRKRYPPFVREALTTIIESSTEEDTSSENETNEASVMQNEIFDYEEWSIPNTESPNLNDMLEIRAADSESREEEHYFLHFPEEHNGDTSAASHSGENAHSFDSPDIFDIGDGIRENEDVREKSSATLDSGDGLYYSADELLYIGENESGPELSIRGDEIHMGENSNENEENRGNSISVDEISESNSNEKYGLGFFAKLLMESEENIRNDTSNRSQAEKVQYELLKYSTLFLELGRKTSAAFCDVSEPMPKITASSLDNNDMDSSEDEYEDVNSVGVDPSPTVEGNALVRHNPSFRIDRSIWKNYGTSAIGREHVRENGQCEDNWDDMSDFQDIFNEIESDTEQEIVSETQAKKDDGFNYELILPLLTIDSARLRLIRKGFAGYENMVDDLSDLEDETGETSDGDCPKVSGLVCEKEKQPDDHESGNDDDDKKA